MYPHYSLSGEPNEERSFFVRTCPSFSKSKKTLRRFLHKILFLFLIKMRNDSQSPFLYMIFPKTFFVWDRVLFPLEYVNGFCESNTKLSAPLCVLNRVEEKSMDSVRAPNHRLRRVPDVFLDYSVRYPTINVSDTRMEFGQFLCKCYLHSKWQTESLLIFVGSVLKSSSHMCSYFPCSQ